MSICDKTITNFQILGFSVLREWKINWSNYFIITNKPLDGPQCQFWNIGERGDAANQKGHFFNFKEHVLDS